MKKSIIFFAAAALALGMVSCTDEPIVPEVIGGGETPVTPMVKSTTDLIGTNWEYTMNDLVIADQNGDTVAVLPLSNLSFGLGFDSTYAHITFPAEVIVMNATTDANGMPTLEELQSLDYAYAYDPTTQTGTLTATAYDDNNQPVAVLVPFSYDIATDAITIDIDSVYEAEDQDGNIMSLTLVFHRI